MKFTGGAIQPDKSFAYLIDFSFRANGEFDFINPASLVANLEVKDNQNIPQPLSIIYPSIGKERLGMFIAPDRNIDN